MKKILLGRKDIVKNIIKNPIAQAFFLNFLLAFFSFIYFIIVNKGLFTLCDDFNQQQIPLSMLSNEAIRSGNVLWNWSIDIGTSFIGGTSFYITGSPFFWLSCLFPKNCFPYLVGWLYMLKYAAAGTTSFCYLKRFSSNQKYALLGSVLYAFSGFQATNLLFYHFHDVVAIFPLLLIGLEQLVKENKKGLLAFAVFMSATLNFYFFVSEVLFLILYFVIRFWMEDFKAWRKIGICMIEGILGVLMSSFLFIPTIAFNLNNPRISVMLPRESWFDFERRYFLKLIRVFLYPADIMSNPSYVLDQDFSSWSAYLPMVGMIFVVCYLLKWKKDWLTRFLYILLLFVVTPILNSSFTMFSNTNYHRWYFMLIMILSLTSMKVMEEREKYPVKRTAFAFIAAVVGITFFSYWWDSHKFALIYDAVTFPKIVMIAMAGYIVTFTVSIICKKETVFFYGMLLGISAFAIGTNAFCCKEYKNYANGSEGNENAVLYYDRMLAMQQIESERAYRIDSADNIVNMSAANQGTGSFISTVNGSVFEFYEAMGGEERKVFTPKGPEGTKELLSARYYITEEKRSDAIQTISHGSYVGYVGEYENALPIGFTYDTYLLRSEFEKCSSDIRAKLMLATLVIPDEEEQRVSRSLQHYKLPENIDSTDLRVEALVEAHKRESATDFEQKKSSFQMNISAGTDKYAFFSIPYDTGWKANVNGKEAAIINTNGLMAVPISAGNNHIEFQYQNLYFYIGIGVTIAGFLLWIGYCRFYKERQGR